MPIRRKKNDPIDTAIAEAFVDLNHFNADADEYKIILKRLERLQHLKDSQSRPGVSPDTWVLAVTNLAGIVLILQHERLHAISSKAFSFILKMR